MEKEKEELRLEEQKKAETGGDRRSQQFAAATTQHTSIHSHTTTHSHFKPLTLQLTTLQIPHTLIERHTHTNNLVLY